MYFAANLASFFFFLRTEFASRLQGKLLTDTDGVIVVVLNSDNMARSDNQLKPNCNSNIVQHWEVDSAMTGSIKETTDDQYGGMVNKLSVMICAHSAHMVEDRKVLKVTFPEAAVFLLAVSRKLGFFPDCEITDNRCTFSVFSFSLFLLAVNSCNLLVVYDLKQSIIFSCHSTLYYTNMTTSLMSMLSLQSKGSVVFNRNIKLQTE